MLLGSKVGYILFNVCSGMRDACDRVGCKCVFWGRLSMCGLGCVGVCRSVSGYVDYRFQRCSGGWVY